jgi:hypothetical protein
MGPRTLAAVSNQGSHFVPRNHLLSAAAWGVILSAVFAAPCLAVRPSETLLPNTTKAYIAVPDVDALRDKFDATQLGQLAKDPVMKAFADDLRQQIKDKLEQSGVRIGLTWEDVQEVYGGEVSLALIQPGGDKKAHATAVIVDTTGRAAETQAMLAKLAKNQAAKGAKKSTLMVGTTELTIYTPTKQPEGRIDGPIVYFVKDDHLVACDHIETAKAIVGRFAGTPGDSLATVPAFAVSMARTSEVSGGVEPHIRWFVEPFGYVEVSRAISGGRKKRGTDFLKVLANQGFSAIQGAGGLLAFATGDHELLHRTFIHAPAVPRKPGEANKDKYDLAARMLDFPNGGSLAAQVWVPRDVATYFSFNWKMKEAFEHAITLVDEIAGEPGFFEDVLDSLEKDPNGPQINLRKEIVAHLGTRASIASDYQLPITPKSERVLFAVASTDPAALSRGVNKAMESDPQATKLEYKGHVIWQMENKPAEEIPTLQIEGADLGPVAVAPADDGEKPLIPNAAICVAHGHLLVATHVDFLKKILDDRADGETLAAAADYEVVNGALAKLAAGEDSFRFFSRTDEEYRTTYELIRQGKMPEAETMLGRLLNQVLGTGEEGVLRKQQIDGKNLPEYQMVRRYLGPAGMYVRSLEDGWLLVGCLLNKDAETVEIAADPAAVTEAK